jgi:hypothetical protein
MRRGWKRPRAPPRAPTDLGKEHTQPPTDLGGGLTPRPTDMGGRRHTHATPLTPTTTLPAPRGHARATSRRLNLGYKPFHNDGKKMGHRAATQLRGGGVWFTSPQMTCLDTGGKMPIDDGTLAACRARGAALMVDARAESTRIAYRGYWCCLVHFILAMGCRDHVAHDYNVSLPILVDTMIAWVGFLSAHYAPGTIDIALAAISLVHEHTGADSPSLAKQVRNAVKGAKRLWDPPLKAKWILLPQHVRAILRLTAVSSGPTCEGTVWSPARLLRLQAAVVIGFIAFLRKSEILAVRTPDTPAYRRMSA